MTDREKIVSDDYYDVISDFQLPGGTSSEFPGGVYQPVDGEIGVAYIERRSTVPISVSNFSYPAIPKLYGLMQVPSVDVFDPTPLIKSGIRQVQESSLALTGQGVVIGFLDTGERVIILLSQQNLSKYKGLRCFSPAKKSHMARKFDSKKS